MRLEWKREGEVPVNGSFVVGLKDGIQTPLQMVDTQGHVRRPESEAADNGHRSTSAWLNTWPTRKSLAKLIIVHDK